MADRFFQNPMPDFVPETASSTLQQTQEPTAVGAGDSLVKLLALPYAPLSERFKRAGLDLKETVMIPRRRPISVSFFNAQILR